MILYGQYFLHSSSCLLHNDNLKVIPTELNSHALSICYVFFHHHSLVAMQTGWRHWLRLIMEQKSMQRKAEIRNNHFYSKFKIYAGRLVSHLNANSGRWSLVYSSWEEERHQVFIIILNVAFFQINQAYRISQLTLVF